MRASGSAWTRCRRLGTGAGLPKFMGIEGENLHQAKARIESIMDTLLEKRLLEQMTADGDAPWVKWEM